VKRKAAGRIRAGGEFMRVERSSNYKMQLDQRKRRKRLEDE
jgi:hypothetical protein